MSLYQQYNLRLVEWWSCYDLLVKLGQLYATQSKLMEPLLTEDCVHEMSLKIGEVKAAYSNNRIKESPYSLGIHPNQLDIRTASNFRPIWSIYRDLHLDYTMEEPYSWFREYGYFLSENFQDLVDLCDWTTWKEVDGLIDQTWKKLRKEYLSSELGTVPDYRQEAQKAKEILQSTMREALGNGLAPIRIRITVPETYSAPFYTIVALWKESVIHRFEFPLCIKFRTLQIFLKSLAPFLSASYACYAFEKNDSPEREAQIISALEKDLVKAYKSFMEDVQDDDRVWEFYQEDSFDISGWKDRYIPGSNQSWNDRRIEPLQFTDTSCLATSFGKS